MIIWHEQVYKDVLNEIFNNNFGDEDTSGDEEEKGASSLLRGLESAKIIIHHLSHFFAQRMGSYLYSVNIIHPQGHPEFSINPVFFATCAPLFINASVVIIYRYYRYIYIYLIIFILFLSMTVSSLSVYWYYRSFYCVSIYIIVCYTYYCIHIWELYKRCGLYIYFAMPISETNQQLVSIILIQKLVSREIMMILQKDDEKCKSFTFLR